MNIKLHLSYFGQNNVPVATMPGASCKRRRWEQTWLQWPRSVW